MPVGFYKRTEEYNKKISEALKIAGFQKGHIPWNKDLKGYHPKGVGFKEGHTPWNKNREIQTNTGRTHFKSGKESPFWKDGQTKLTDRIRSSEKYLKWRADVFRRDGWTCQTCGLRGHGRDIEAHHIKPMREILQQVQIKNLDINDRYLLAMGIKELFDVNNGITLCGHCHGLTFKISKKGEIE